MATSSNKYTPKQIAKYKRQKCIGLLEKTIRNVSKMFRDETTTKEQLRKRFFGLKQKIDALGHVALDSEYNKAMKQYIEQLALTLESMANIDAIRKSNISAINRIQKIKNATSYKKEKHKNTLINE